jgi:uncharacterized membrane protein YqhA
MTEPAPVPELSRPNIRILPRALIGFRQTSLLIAVLFTLIASAFLMFVGVYQGIQAMTGFLDQYDVKRALSGLIKTMDIFLTALVMMLLALGLYDLFGLPQRDLDQRACRGWHGFADTLDHLKSSLARLIVLILIITFLELVLASLEELTGVLMLVVPAGVLMTALSLRLLKHDSAPPDLK